MTHIGISRIEPRVWVNVFLGLVAAMMVGCSKVRLFQAPPPPGSLTGSSVGLLPPPTNTSIPLRIMIFVDQSYSMVRHKCATDLDGDQADTNGPECTGPEGNDFRNDRMAVIEDWLRQLEALGHQNLKVAIRPFSGGITRRPLGGDSSQMLFRDLAGSKTWLNQLKQEHETSKSGPPQKMGTTVPLTQLRDAATLVDQEMDQLAQNDLLENARFQFVYMTDGVFRPLEDLYKKALRLSKCDCPADGSGLRAVCDPNFNWGSEGTNPRDYCLNIFPRDFESAFGNYRENEISGIASEIERILDLPRVKAGGRLQFHLVRIHPERTPAEDKETPKNIFDSILDDAALKRRLQARTLKVHTLNSAEPPFAVSSASDGSTSFRIRELFALNLNAVVDRYGNLVSDSDGDGLPDKEEVGLGLNPTQPRTANAKCLDGLSNKYGCKVFNCATSYDDDADGLNECEENTITSAKDSADSDEDLLMDRFETLRGLDPLHDDRAATTAGQVWTDHHHFQRGVFPTVDLGLVPFENQVQVQANFEGETPDGALYQLNILNIPLVSTLRSEGEAAMKRRKPLGREVEIPMAESLGGTAHEPDMNQILFLVQVQSMENPENKYWLFKRENIRYQGRGHVRFDVDLSKFYPLTLLKN